MSFAWSLQPLVGISGTLLNSFVLYMEYGERQTFIRPVNAMIWYVSINLSLRFIQILSKTIKQDGNNVQTYSISNCCAVESLHHVN